MENSTSMLYTDKSLNKFPRWEFHASNEYDWYKAPLDFSETDTVVAFGTNSAWDIAVRKNAKSLVIADWHEGTLLTQEYLLRPMILEAKSPEEFLAMLAVCPVHLKEINGDLIKTFEIIDKIIFNSGLDKRGPLARSRFDFANNIIDRMRKNLKISEKQIEAVESYYNDLLFRQFHSDSDFGSQFGPIGGHFVERFYRGIKHGEGTLYPLFKERYNPIEALAAKIKPEIVNSKFYSFISSPEAFRRIQKIFDGNIYYAHTGYDDAFFYKKIKNQFGDGKNHRYTLSITNILDVIADSSRGQREKLREFLSLIGKELSPAKETPLVIFRTMKTSPPHGFGIYTLSTSDGLNTSLEVNRGRGTFNSIDLLIPTVPIDDRLGWSF